MTKYYGLWITLILLFTFNSGFALETLPVRGFCIGAPKPAEMDAFVKFIDKELAPRKVNTLIVRIDYNYQYESQSGLRDASALSKSDVKKMVEVCRKNNIQIIPQINLLGHQSWAGKINNLLRVYPEFDETPRVKLPEKYEWPNSDGLYCKSYCPLHPEVHTIIFPLIDEICDIFESTTFHAGMDEVFYIGDDKCPRCSGKDKAELFAGEVNLIRNHLALKNRTLWIWGDRLLDGKTTGLGMWEASMNNTSRAIDMIYKDVIICDWHYDRPEQTAVYFAVKGFGVITCPWRKSENGVRQTQDMFRFRASSSAIMKDRFQGIMQTIWTGAGQFMDEFYNRNKEHKSELSQGSQTDCFRAIFSEIQKYTDGRKE